MADTYLFTHDGAFYINGPTGAMEMPEETYVALRDSAGYEVRDAPDPLVLADGSGTLVD